jgi:hypothetical protein
MPTLIPAPTIIHAAGNRPKRIEEYTGPAAGGAEYVAVCLPAFSPDTVHRDTAS